MADLVFVAVVAGFFALAVLFVRACDRLVGPDTDLAAVPPTSAPAAPGDPAETRAVAS
jgi:hypothetical protein